MIPLWLFWKLTLNILYNAYCFVHKHHERTFLRRKPCYRRRRKEEEANKKKTYNSIWNRERLPFFFLLLSPYFFFLKLFVSVKSTFFRSKLSSFSSFSLSSCWSCRDAISLYTHEKKQKKKINFCGVVCFVFLYIFVGFV